MGILNEEETLVLIIDVQEKLLNAAFNKEKLRKNASIIAKATTILEMPIVLTEQYPKGLGTTIQEVKNYLCNDTKIFEKSSFSALDEEDVFDEIKTWEKPQVVVAGIETHICVNQTVNALIELGYEVSVIADACGSRAEEEHFAGLNRMRENGAHILTTEIALFEWLKSSKHPKFKEIQNLIK